MGPLPRPPSTFLTHSVFGLASPSHLAYTTHPFSLSLFLELVSLSLFLVLFSLPTYSVPGPDPLFHVMINDVFGLLAYQSASPHNPTSLFNPASLSNPSILPNPPTLSFPHSQTMHTSLVPYMSLYICCLTFALNDDSIWPRI